MHGENGVHAMPTLTKTWTEKELLALPKDRGKYELVDGELVFMPPAGFEHGDISGEALSRLRTYVRRKKLGRVVDGQTGFWMKSGNLRSPDVSFVSKQRLLKLTRLPTGFFLGTPDMVVEVLSPDDRMSNIEKKIRDYFESGTKLLWLVNPVTRTVRVYRDPDNYRLLTIKNNLAGEDIVPGFSMAVKKLFE